ncbi:hypothetical protein OE88DRAFT_369054 [Heliocybe sulcata]|uniref:F-box domain-containing protein n=1 Tax=Heliocybe sulcata TaxID=5364 RepID=A0A5C3MW02_9AGAM|nr:hypothetical protein OE88DRAFT_369054 [Heliocybe sulcata]
MHAALRQQDVLRLILSFFDNPRWQSTDVGDLANCSRTTREPPDRRNTLLSCVLTCRTFKDPSLDILWKQIHSPFPMLRLLSNFRQLDGKFVLRGQISTEELQRFEWYAGRVRLFQCAATDLQNMDQFVFHRLSVLLGTPIFPGLRALSWELGAPVVLPAPFIASTLESVSIYLQSSTEASPLSLQLDAHALISGTEVILDSLAASSPALKGLHFYGLRAELPIVDATPFKSLQSFSAFKHPRADVAVCSSELLSSLGALNELAHICVHTSRLSFRDTVLAPFRCLAAIGLCGVPRDLARILAALQNSSIDWINLTIDTPDNSMESMFCNAAFPRLVEFEVGPNRKTQIPPSVDTLLEGRRLLLPFTKCKVLETFNVKLKGFIVSITDDEVWAVAQAWPRIREFTWLCKGAPSTPTIGSLAAFATSCLKLTTLALPLNLNVQVTRAPLISVHRLKRLTAYGRWEPISMLRAAELLVTMFPYLETVEVAEDEDNEQRIDRTLNETIRMLQRMKTVFARQNLMSSRPAAANT